MDSDWSTRQAFERYLYDYLVKRNMHRTADVFRNEANLQLDPDASSSNVMEVPEGFLLEWWSLNYDFDIFRAWLQMHETHGLEAMQGCNASQEAGCSMNEEAMNQLPDNFTPVEAFNIGSNSMPSHVIGELPLLFMSSSHQEVSVELSQLFLPIPHQEVSGELPQPFLATSHQEEQLTSPVETINEANTNDLEVKYPKTEYTTLIEETDPMIENLLNSFWLFEQDQPSLFDDTNVGESNKNIENFLTSIEGNTGINEFADSPYPKDEDNESETSDCSSNFRRITSDANSSMAHLLESNEET